MRRICCHWTMPGSKVCDLYVCMYMVVDVKDMADIVLIYYNVFLDLFFWPTK